MAFVRAVYENLEQHCKDLLTSANLQNNIYFLADSAKEVRVTFDVVLSQGQRDTLSADACFNRFLTHADRDAVILDRWA